MAIVRCDICGKHYIKSDVICYDIDDNIICENCVDKYVRFRCDDEEPTEATCDVCNEKIVDSKRYLLDGNTVCTDCIDDYVSECQV